MRRSHFLAFLCAVISANAGTLFSHDAQAQKARCLANAHDASFAIWSRDSLQRGQVVSGMHPCGRRMRCTARIPGVTATRVCKWL